jgi:hypothetical protein
MRRDEVIMSAATDRRAFLAAAGTFAAVTPPAMTMLLSTSLASPAIAASGRGSYQGDEDDHGKEGSRGNNGVGNGPDPQPPGNPPVNDGPGTGPGNPGNRGGHD